MTENLIIPSSYFENIKKLTTSLPLQNIEQGLRLILDSQQKPYEKLVLYIEILERFLRNAGLPKKDSQPSAQNKTVDTKPEQVKDENDSKPDIAGSLSAVLGNKNNHKGLALLSFLQKEPKISWDSDHALYLNATKIENSNIFDVLSRLTGPKPKINKLVPGYEELSTFLKHSSRVPKTLYNTQPSTFVPEAGGESSQATVWKAQPPTAHPITRNTPLWQTLRSPVKKRKRISHKTPYTKKH